MPDLPLGMVSCTVLQVHDLGCRAFVVKPGDLSLVVAVKDQRPRKGASIVLQLWSV